ncbi:MAG: MarR family transcriptional regulator [Candidatus Marinimicrobia bacterium]|jgi:DNA-binding MarR family transcriptional regulator|nr:MarR family transcriptional regulator [Candidatus Neomarinimicrobiota bacterium]MBT3796674.1 MarR family transcriptional regulator [Candidatus Neomarinimicrobiota bacterium]MBT4318828.1 MarR family transcriptional regulator [Candidatus Neomarinimicrobiota bacterium]MBT4783794.1 MarR family transcriptional regulator [Candidatus Neomarinimicrobiota bacterium]MBT5097577.1 MarR family transcriptional regulator [Candidatus Neomarinimicrobiota bacterium]
MKLHNTPMPVLLGLSHRLVVKKFKELIESLDLELTFDQFMVLMPIWKLDGISQQQIVEGCGKDKTSVTRIITTLENKNFVLRIKDLNDARLNHIYLTKFGKQTVEKVIPVMRQTRNYIKKDINENDYNIARSVIIQLIEKLDPNNG